MSGFRKHGRKPVRCPVKLSHCELGDVVAETRDISESGLFVRCKDLLDYLAIGEEIETSLFNNREEVSQGLLTVVRMTDEGIALAY